MDPAKCIHLKNLTDLWMNNIGRLVTINGIN